MVEKISRTSRRGLIISAGIMTWNFYIYGSAEDSGIRGKWTVYMTFTIFRGFQRLMIIFVRVY